MTKEDAIDAIAAQLDDFTDPMKQRIIRSIPVGVGIFCSEYQWEFLDKYTTTTSAEQASTGKHRITKPADFFKVVVMSTETCPEIQYVDRRVWHEAQTGLSGTTSPQAYTVIGDNLYLLNPASGETIYMTYTRDSSNVTFDNLADQYRPAVVMAAVMWLTPSVLQRDGGDVANPAFDAAEVRYLRHVNKAFGIEKMQKGRPQLPRPNNMMKLRSQQRR